MGCGVPYNETSTFANNYTIVVVEYEGLTINASSFSVRTMRRFSEKKIVTIADLLRTTPEELMCVKGFGKTCLDEVNNFCQGLQSKGIEIIDTSEITTKAVPTLIRENVEQIVFGNFSFVEEISLTGNEIKFLRLYEEAFDILGSELAFDCVSSPERIKPIITMFNDFCSEATRHHIIYELVEKIPSRRRSNFAVGYINAFVSDDSKRRLLHNFFTSEISILESIVTYLNFENNEAFRLLKKFLNWCTFDLNEEIDQLFTKLYSNDRVQTVIKLRARKQTLEQIGNQLGVTRERVRQIEVKAKRNFSRLNGHIKIISKISAERNSDSVLTSAEIGDFCGEYSEDLIYLLRSFQSVNYIYDSQLDVFIVGDDSLQDRVQSYLETLPDIISSKQLDEILDSAKEEDIPEEMLKKAFEDVYHLTGNVYHRARLSLANIYATILRKYYPTGIRVYDSEEIKKFREYVAAEYGDVCFSRNDRALAARITDVCTLCGRGTYILKKKQYIPKELSDRIYKYILESESPIFLTNTLFSIFENELAEIGVDNKYYLQGILRELFADVFVFSRDYISKDPDITSIYSTIVAYIKQSQYPVSKKQIQLTFPGVTEVVINFAVSDPTILNYFGEYLHASNMFISDFEKEYLNALINKVISDGNVHHSRELFEKIDHDKPEILTRNFAMIPFSTFSVLEHLFKDRYQFSRPYIAKNGIDIGRPAERLHDLIYSSDEFAVSDISEFSKENRFQIQSLLEYVNTCNDQFLLVNSNLIMNIDRIGITDSIANEIENILCSEVTETMLISKLLLWNKLPKVAVPWTDWLLYSVIYKWGKRMMVSTTSNQFRLSAPLVAPAGLMNSEAYKDFDKLTAPQINKVDDLDNIDELLEDIIGDEIWEVAYEF